MKPQKNTAPADLVDMLIAAKLDLDLDNLLGEAIRAHQHTDGRTAKVSLVVSVAIDKDSGASKIHARITAAIPTGDSDTVAKKHPKIQLKTIGQPGQTEIETEPADLRSKASNDP